MSPHMEVDWSKHYRKTSLPISEQVEAALSQPERNEALRMLVRKLFAEGNTRPQL